MFIVKDNISILIKNDNININNNIISIELYLTSKDNKHIFSNTRTILLEINQKLSQLKIKDFSNEFEKIKDLSSKQLNNIKSIKTTQKLLPLFVTALISFNTLSQSMMVEELISMYDLNENESEVINTTIDLISTMLIDNLETNPENLFLETAEILGQRHTENTSLEYGFAHIEGVNIGETIHILGQMNGDDLKLLSMD